MASYGQSVTVTYVAWNTSTNSGQTGDVANHTLRWVKDGTSAAPTNAASEVDATNAPGIYKITLTATECQCNVGIICGKSSTANVSIMPLTISFEQLPTAVPASSGGLLTFGTGAGQINVDGAGNASANVAKWNSHAVPAENVNGVPLVDAKYLLGTIFATPATAGILDANVKNINNVAAATPGAAGGILIAGTNAATTFTGTAASGATPATAGITVTGGAASTTSGGTSAAGILVTGGAGAASTNGAAAGISATAGGTTTVSGNDGAVFTATGNGNGLTAAHAGTGKDFNAQTTNSLQVNMTAISGAAVSTSSAQLGVNVVNYNGHAAVTDGNNYPSVNIVDIAGSAVSTSTAQLGVNAVQVGGGTVANGSVPNAVAGATGGLFIAGSNAATTVTGTAASGSTPATAGLTLVGGAASTTSGGTAAAGLSVTGGAGAASTNGAAVGLAVIAGGTTTVSGNDGATFTGTGNGNGVTYAHAGSGLDLNAQTTNSLQVDVRKILGTASAGTAGYVGIDWGHINAPTTAVDLSGTTIKNLDNKAAVTLNAADVTGDLPSNVIQWNGTSVGTLPPDSVFIRTGTAQGGGASTITLDSGASATNNLYQDCVIQIRGGTGAGQSAIIASYVGATKVATINGSWATNPDATSTFTILPFGSISASVSGNVTVGGYAGGEDPATLVWGALRSSFTTSGTFGQGVASVQGNVTGSVASVTAAVTVGTNNDKTGYRLLTEIRNGTAQAGAASSITLDSGASATDSLYKGCWIVLTGGTGVGQARLCTAYVGATKVATVSPNWTTNPDSTSVFTVLPAGDVLDVANSVNQTGDSYAIVNSGTFGNSALHTQIGSPWQVGTKYNVLLNASDVTGNVTADLQTIKTQTVTCAAGVTIGAFVGNATHAIAVDASGFVTFNNTSIATATSVTNPVTLTAPDSPIDFTCTLGSQAGATSSQVILNGGPATDGILVGQRVRVYSGTGNHQERVITSYNHTTGVTGIDWPWTTQPASGDTAAVLYADSPALNSSLDITLPAIPSGWITAAGIAAGALNGKGDWLLASNYTTSVTVAAYAANEDPWSIIKAASPSATPSAGTVELLLRLLDADWSIDTTTTPWDLVATIKGTGLPSSMGGTGTEILRKRIRDTGSANIGNTSTAVGQMIQ